MLENSRKIILAKLLIAILSKKSEKRSSNNEFKAHLDAGSSNNEFKAHLDSVSFHGCPSVRARPCVCHTVFSELTLIFFLIFYMKLGESSLVDKSDGDHGTKDQKASHEVRHILRIGNVTNLL